MTNSTSIDAILARFANVKSSGDGKWTCRCPNHADERNSLSIGVGNDGKSLLFCHAGCTTADILAAVQLKLSDLFPGSNGHTATPSFIIAKYNYCDAEENLLYQVCRYHPKGFRQRRPDEHGNWVWNLTGVRKVLYRLPQLIDAIQGDENQSPQIFVVEGEKDADRLAELGLTATTCAAGAGKWQDSYGDMLCRCHVTILPDADKPGRDHAQSVARSCQGKAGSIRIVNLPDLPDKGDISDWLHAGGTKERLLQLVDAAAEWTPETQPEFVDEPKSEPNRIEYRRLTCRELAGGDFDEEYLIDDVFVARQPCIFGGPRKGLKTNLLVDFFLSLTTGTDFLDKFKVTRVVKCGFMSGESGLSTLQKHSRAVASSKGLQLADVSGLVWSPDLPKFGHIDHIDALKRFIIDDEIEVLGIDPAYLSIPTQGREGSVFAMGEYLRSASELCERLGCTLVIAHHCTKPSAVKYEPATLDDLTWSGFAEWARQWFLLSRREQYEVGSHMHRLWASIGGSAGHGSLWGIDAYEGARHDRTWQVEVLGVDDVRQQDEGSKQSGKETRQREKIDRDKKAILKGIVKLPDHQGTLSDIRARSGRNGQAFSLAFAELVDDSDLVPVHIFKANRKTPYEGYRLKDDTPC